MVFTRLLCLCSLLLAVVPVCVAHEIYLKNGSVIETDHLQRSQSRLTYHQFGGEISIPVAEVEKIIYSNDKSRKTPATREPPDGVNSGRDLKAALESKMAPRGPIEQANLAVLSILTAAGSGSGFFINRDGLIVTNRHVIRGSERNNEKIEQAVTEARERLVEWDENLQREKIRIDTYQKNVRQNRESFEKMARKHGDRMAKEQRLAMEQSLKNRSQYLEEWFRDYKRRKNTFLEKKLQVDREWQDFRKKNRALAGQSRFTVTLADGQDLSAILYRVSDRYDLALLKLNGYQ
ncbi:MAG: trypsin-like peptidase domain-containing protein, partial [Desulfocapsaceae bacterium]|nr:trypsin-like peptidase domain-containing protein [Desulfocapsaceae bacterium]